MQNIFTVGYGVWPCSARMAGLLKVLKEAGVELLVDVRHSACASQTSAGSNYGPKAWNLQAEGGVNAALNDVGIGYLWLPELGNPQKNDQAMTVMRKHLREESEDWPAQRGLALLQPRLQERVCCLMCGCNNYDECHRKLVAETVLTRDGFGGWSIINLSKKGAKQN